MDKCKNYMTQSACLLRQMAEGSVVVAKECQHCEATLAELELELEPQLIRQVTAVLRGDGEVTGPGAGVTIVNAAR